MPASEIVARTPSLAVRVLAEWLGTLLLLTVVIGSGIMAERLSGGNSGVALLANTLATVCGLYVLIEVFRPISGAHFNPAVSAMMALRGALPRSALAPYVLAQLVGSARGSRMRCSRRRSCSSRPTCAAAQVSGLPRPSRPRASCS